MNFQNISSAFDNSAAEPVRLWHGRGVSLEPYRHFCIDWLPPSLVVTLYDESARTAALDIAHQLHSVRLEIERIWLQCRFMDRPQFELISGEGGESQAVVEKGLFYQLNFTSGLHSGLFLDMALAREWVRNRAANKSVLNLFAHTCAFSVAAVAGGAHRVVNLDMNRHTLATGRLNHRLNQHDPARVRYLGHDLFKSFGRLKREGPFDLVVVDPPSYQPGSFCAERDYVRIIRRLGELISCRADLLLCLNSPYLKTEFLLDMVATTAPDFSFQYRLENPVGFEDQDPDKALKVLYFKAGALTGAS